MTEEEIEKWLNKHRVTFSLAGFPPRFIPETAVLELIALLRAERAERESLTMTRDEAFAYLAESICHVVIGGGGDNRHYRMVRDGRIEIRDPQRNRKDWHGPSWLPTAIQYTALPPLPSPEGGKEGA